MIESLFCSIGPHTVMYLRFLLNPLVPIVFFHHGTCISSINQSILVRCAALRTLRSHGQLEEVTRVTTMATLLYAAPAWWGFASEGDMGRIERFIGRLRR